MNIGKKVLRIHTRGHEKHKEKTFVDVIEEVCTRVRICSRSRKNAEFLCVNKQRKVIH